MMDQHAYLEIAAGDDVRVGDMIAFDISHPCLTFDRCGQFRSSTANIGLSTSCKPSSEPRMGVKCGGKYECERYGPEAGASSLPIARAVEANGWLYVSGQVPMADGVLVTGSITVQARQAIRNLFSVLSEAGYGPNMWSGAEYGSKIRGTSAPSTLSFASSSADIPRTLVRCLQHGCRCKVEIECVAYKDPAA